MINFLLFLFINFSINEFENAFLKKDLGTLNKYFANEKKVYMEFSIPLRVYGFFSRSQVLALFREIFQRFDSEEFKVVEKIEGPDSLILKVEWRMREKLRNEIKKANVFIRLHFEGSKGYIVEIKGA